MTSFFHSRAWKPLPCGVTLLFSATPASPHKRSCHAMVVVATDICTFVTDHVRSTRGGNIFSRVCLPFDEGGGGRAYPMIYCLRQEGSPPSFWAKGSEGKEALGRTSQEGPGSNFWSGRRHPLPRPMLNWDPTRFPHPPPPSGRRNRDGRPWSVCVER